MGDGDTRIFEDDAEGKKAFAAFQAAAGTSLNRDKLVSAIEQGRKVDLSTAGAQEEFFGKNFANAVQSQSKEDRADMVRYFKELLGEITNAVQDAAVVAKDLKERQDREKAYRAVVKKLNDDLKGLTASLASATRQTE